MAEGSKLWLLCPHCKGTGKSYSGEMPEVPPEAPPFDEVCPVCNGSGYVFAGWVAKEEEALPDNLPPPILPDP